MSDRAGIPSLAEHLAGGVVHVPRAAPSRVHLIDDERETKASTGARTLRVQSQPPAPAPIIKPFDPTGEEAMPRKKKAAPEAAAAPAESVKKRRGPKPGYKRKADGQPIGAASFVIDDRGGMEIRDGQQAVRLERADVQRLDAFMEQTKAIRK